jgi:Flp pilus assembly protein TadG
MLPTKRGQALVEMALMAPVLFLMVLGATDLSQLFYYSTSVTNAAREGARQGAYFDPMGSPAGNSYANDTAVYSAVNNEASYLNLSEPCHPNTVCSGTLTNCPSFPYANALYPTAANTGYVFVCFNNSTTATTATVGQPIRVTVLYSFQPVTPLIGTMVGVAASTEILTQGNG